MVRGLTGAQTIKRGSEMRQMGVYWPKLGRSKRQSRAQECLFPWIRRRRGGRTFVTKGKTMADYSALKLHLRGELIQPGDGSYDDARRLYNAMIDKKPDAIARCVDVADVMACVNHARTNGILLAV